MLLNLIDKLATADKVLEEDLQTGLVLISLPRFHSAFSSTFNGKDS